jgi:prepilin-type processing-associated H-X9-DG protein
MGYVVLDNLVGGTSIRSRTGPNNPRNPSSNLYWIPPHAQGNSLNILYLDGHVEVTSVPYFISDEFFNNIITWVDQ